MARQLPHVWKWFFLMPQGADFYYDGSIYFKGAFCIAHDSHSVRSRFIFPFQRVRTTQLLRDAPSGGLLPPGPSDAQLQEKVNLILHGTTHPQWSLPCDGSFNGEPRRANTSRRIEFILSGEKPFADDGRTGPSA